MISVQNISKTYNKGSVSALKDVSFQIETGEIFGLIGPDGAGKSSLFRIITTLLLPDSGNASVNNYDVIKDFKEIRKQIGYMPGKFSLYQDLTVEENLNFFATIFSTDIQTNYHLIKDIYEQLKPFKDRRAGKLSGGMKQKLALCCALIHKPIALFLDEPTTGVDVVSRREFWEMLKKLKAQGLTILVSTPYMDEASLCDRIAFISKGSLLSIDSPEQFIKKYPKKLYGVNADNTYQLLKSLRALNETDSCFAFGDKIHWTLKDDYAEANVQQILAKTQLAHVELAEIKAGLEDCFIQILGNQ